MSKVRLAEVVERSSGGGTPARDVPSFWDGPIPWATVKDFKDGVRHLSSVQESITKLGLNSSSSNLIPAGTPIICMRMAVGRVAIASMPVAINQDLRALFVHAAFDPDFVVWSLNGIRSQIENEAIGSTVKGISVDRLLSFEIFDAALTEQSKIAEVLSTVDRAIAQTEALIAKQQRIKTGLMQDLLTRGIDEHGQLRSEATHAFKDSPLGRIPVEWEVLKIDDFVSRVGSGVTPTGGESVYTAEGVLFIRSQNVYFDGLRLDDVAYIPMQIHRSMMRSEVFENDVLLNITGASIGRCCRMPKIESRANVNQHVCTIRLQDTDEAHAGFLTAVLQSHIGQHQILLMNAGGNREGLNYQQVRSFRVPWPSDSLEFARTNSELERMSATATAYCKGLAKLRHLKTALMQDLLTGKVRVTPLLEPIEEATP